jgi:hypothetical protein
MKNTGIGFPVFFMCKFMIQQITANGGNWPTTNRNLIAKHMTTFLRFVKSIDFNALQ